MKTFKRRDCGRILLLSAVILGAALNVNAAQITWDGSDNTSWTDGNNWVGGVAPGTGDEAIIPDAGTTTNDPTISSGITISILTIQNSGILNIATGSGLTVNGNGTPTNGDITIGTNGQLNLAGTASVTLTDDISGAGTLSAGLGASNVFIGGDMTIQTFNQGLYYDGGYSTVTFNGSSAQQIQCPAAATYAFNNLVINNTSGGVTQAEDVEIDLDLSGSGTYIASGSITITILGDLSVAGFTASTSTFAMWGDLVLTTGGGSADPQAQSIDHPSGGTYTFYNFDNANQNNTLIDGTVVITNNFNFTEIEGTPGKFIIGNNQVTIDPGATVTGYDNTMYFVTDGSTDDNGFLRMSVPNTGLEFPVGHSTGSYNPITMDHANGSDVNFDIKVFGTVTDDDGTALSSDAVDRTWLALQRHTGALSGVTSLHKWESGHHLTSFDQANCYISYRTPTNPGIDGASGTVAWNRSQSAGAAGGSGTGVAPYTRTSGSIGSGGSMTNNTRYFLAVGDNGSPLPVSWLSFNAALKGKQVELNWETASELNNSHFEVQRSTDGKTWGTIGRIEGHGTSGVVNSYTYMDAKAPVSMNTVYYRLKQIDYNGEFDYSVTRSVRVGRGEPVVQYYPNPATDKLTISTDLSESGATSITIMDPKGNILYSEPMEGEGAVQKQIDVSTFPAGMYFLQIVSGSGTSAKIIYKN